MTPEREVRAMLRGATNDGLLSGWCGVGPFGEVQSWVVTPASSNRAMTLQNDEVADYCEGLRDSGVQPLFRASEPLI